MDFDSIITCRHCDLPKPKFAHHCRICRRCGITDHHCVSWDLSCLLSAVPGAEVSSRSPVCSCPGQPFTGNCVGVGNIANFWLWLVYLAVGMTFALSLSAPSFRLCVWEPMWEAEPPPSQEDLGFDHCDWVGSLSLVFVPLLLVWLGVLVLLIFETWLMWTEQTTIDVCLRFQTSPLEVLSNRRRAPWKSFRSVFRGLKGRGRLEAVAQFLYPHRFLPADAHSYDDDPLLSPRITRDHLR